MRNIFTIYGEGVIGLSRFKKALQSKLTWYLIGCIILSAVVAFVLFYLILFLGDTYIENCYDDAEENRTFQKKYIAELQEYINENQITLSNISDLGNWTEQNVYVYLVIYWNNQVVFNSDVVYYGGADNSNLTTEETDYYSVEGYLYQLTLADDTKVSADIFCYDYWQYEIYTLIAALVLSTVLFIVIFIRLFRKKLRYINQIESELRILEGGNLEYPMTIKGNDEIGNLARGIDKMRLSIIENMKKEKLVLQANKDLVTSLSHDLRTPLTTLTGYLEILNMNNDKDEEEKKHYLELSLAKTREIKELSDELFEYFLIYGEEEKKLELEEIPAYLLTEDLIENQFLYLEEEGYQLESSSRIDETSGNCRIDVKYMQRVLGNIISNLYKYADMDRPIQVVAEKERGFLLIKVKNGIRKNIDNHESTKIGLITCERIMKLHHGEFETKKTEDEFTVCITIPLV